MATVLSPPERLVTLRGISWHTYNCIIAEHGERGGTRFTYDDGVLEIMVLSSRHEEANRTLALLVEVLAEEMSVDLRRFGSTTFRRQDLQKGFEPDSCFYIQNVQAVTGKDEIDLSASPPPDLIIEVDITGESLDRLPIFAAVGVPELWRSDGDSVAIFRLEGAHYGEAHKSLAFPQLTREIATRFLRESHELSSTAWLRGVREWARSNVVGVLSPDGDGR
ncbi:MAG TPA: Uma2 family endonuclease [Blastocatellia bacterium]|nr:Uma2 family endonuclease [Blastocatellia bacterium]